MDRVALEAFSDELEKIAGLRDLWQRFLDLFRSEDTKVQRRVDYHFSPKAGVDRWDKLVRNAQDQKFVNALRSNDQADDKLVMHAQSMHDLAVGQPVGKIESSTLPGRKYEIRKTPRGLACQCNDWRFKGSVNPGYECKHIRAFREGKVRP